MGVLHRHEQGAEHQEHLGGQHEPGEGDQAVVSATTSGNIS